VEAFLFHHVVGQQLALQQLVDAVCTHIHKHHPSKPLILSIHGPPGVGKTYSHTLLAKALYNRHPEQVLYCPGMDCRGAKVKEATIINMF
jgi:ATP-dependent Clp protease ATP-binding subunit ClpA